MRPNTNDLATATYNLSLLASRHHPRHDPNHSSGFDIICRLINWLIWVELSIDESREAAAIGPGVEGGIRTLPRSSGHADIDARTHDMLLKEQRRYRSSLHVQLGNVDNWATREAEALVGRQGVGTVAQ